MIPLGTYLLQMSCWLAAFWLVYASLLKRETYFNLNRWFLNLGLLVSLILPLIPIKYNVQLKAQAFTTTVTQSVVVQTIESNSNINFWLIAYFLGALFFISRFIIQHVKLYTLRKRSQSISIDSLKVYQIEKETAPFSFFNQIYVSSKLSSSIELKTVVAHEKVHIHERHWADLLLLEVVRALQWFNPLLQLYRKAIMQNHEFLADSGTIEFGVSAHTYKAIIANQMLGVPVVSFANSFTLFNSTNRILMMNKDKSTPIKRLKILLIVPLMAIIVMGFAKPKYIFNENSSTPPLATNSITNGKVYDMYGKLMEGVEVSSISIGTTTTSNENGEFTLNGIKDKDDILAEKNGYTHSSTLEVENGLAVLMGGHGQQAVSKETIQIKGKVTDQNGEALPGASVIVSGTNYGTVADLKGEFILDAVKLTDNIVVSFVGYETTISPAKKEMKFKMNRDIVELEILQEESVPPPPPPLPPFNDFGGNPLILIDGEISTIDPNSIDPNSIQSISVLKDQSAIDKYGEKAKDGVILISTKKITEPVRKSPNNEVFIIVEDMPEYPGGIDALNAYIQKRVEGSKESGTVHISFVIDNKGIVSNVKVAKSTNEKLNAKALKIVNDMPQWKPGKQRGKPVKVDYTIPIIFGSKTTGTIPVNNGNSRTVDNSLNNGETAPEFPGGTNVLVEYIKKTNSNITINEKTIFQFFIDEQGKVYDVKAFENEPKNLIAISNRIIEGMPKWMPGIQNGKPEKSIFQVDLIPDSDCIVSRYKFQ